MNQNEIIKISTDDRDWLISLKSCDKKSDGQFIRQLTKENGVADLSYETDKKTVRSY